MLTAEEARRRHGAFTLFQFMPHWMPWISTPDR